MLPVAKEKKSLLLLEQTSWLERHTTATKVDSIENSHCLQEFKGPQTWKGPQHFQAFHEHEMLPFSFIKKYTNIALAGGAQWIE